MNKRKALIIGSFILAAILVYWWLKPSKKEQENKTKSVSGVRLLNQATSIRYKILQ